MLPSDTFQTGKRPSVSAAWPVSVKCRKILPIKTEARNQIEFPNQPDFPEQHTAVAVGTINMSQQAIRVLIENATEKASILTIARVSAIQSIKQTANLIPLHLPGRIIGVQVDFDI